MRKQAKVLLHVTGRRTPRCYASDGPLDTMRVQNGSGAHCSGYDESLVCTCSVLTVCFRVSKQLSLNLLRFLFMYTLPLGMLGALGVT